MYLYFKIIVNILKNTTKKIVLVLKKCRHIIHISDDYDTCTLSRIAVQTNLLLLNIKG